MQWQEIILNRLNIELQAKTILIDHIGLLTDPSFTSYLSEKKINFLLVNDVPSILNALQKTKLVIAPAGLTLPAYLENHTAIMHFDVRKLPIEIEPNLLANLSLSQLTALIAFLNETGNLQLVDEKNYRHLLKDTEIYLIQKELNLLKAELSERSLKIQNHTDILELGRLWGRYVALCTQVDEFPDRELTKTIDQSTESLILGGIIRNAFYESTPTFKTVDKIIPYIKSHKPDKFALVCFDAMGVAEWHLLKRYLSDSGLYFNEKYIFALIPTITRISRSAIFYGNVEQVYGLKTINEDKAFEENFSDCTVRSFREGELTHKDQLLGINAVKIIYNVFDDLAHKTILPVNENRKNIYFKNVENYLAKTRINEELRLLSVQGFKLWFCSDHGSIVAAGNGQRIDKYLIDASCKRATIIEKTELAKFYDVNQYEIPFVKDKIVLLAKNRTSFSNKNKLEITHGGISLEELVVPFVEIIS